MPNKSSRRQHHSPEGATILKNGKSGKSKNSNKSRGHPQQQQQQQTMMNSSSSGAGPGGGPHPVTPPSSTTNINTASLDLKVIDDAFGKTSDLYTDVLQVSTGATQEEIQLAYFDRRSELFTLLAKIDSKPQSESMVTQRYKAERKMDSVVLAVRILGDPSLRATYDGSIRPNRVLSSKKKTQQQHQQHQQIMMMQQQQQQQQQQQGSAAAAATNNGSNRRSRTRSASRTRGGGTATGTGSARQPLNKYDVPAAVVTPTANGGNDSDGVSLLTGGAMIGNGGGGGGDGDATTATTTTLDMMMMEQTAIEMQPQPPQPPSSSSSPHRGSRSNRKTSSSPSGRERSPKKKRHHSSSSNHDSSSSGGGWFGFGKNKNSGGSGNDSTSNIDDSEVDSKAAVRSMSNGRSRNGQISSMDTFENDESGRGSTTMESRQESETQLSQADTQTIETLSTAAADKDTDAVKDGKEPSSSRKRKASASDSDKRKGSKSSGSGGDGGFFSCLSGNRTLKTISDEISGACEDTLVSVDQVFNAFTLTDKDIKAVTKKIDKAKRQLDN